LFKISIEEGEVVAVAKNPFEEWERLRASSDYRSTDTQATSLVRQQLSQPEYLSNSNRVNPGPLRNFRAGQADSKDQLAHNTYNEEMWGWQAWAEASNQLSESTVADILLEQNTVLDPNQPTNYVPPVITPPEPVVPESPASVLTTRTNLKSVQYDQIEPRATWTITHNLGYYPSVELFNNEWDEIDGYVNHLTKNTVRVELTLPLSGHARLI
jgi:hypothetical protein